MRQEEKNTSDFKTIDPLTFSKEWLSLSQRLSGLWAKTLETKEHLKSPQEIYDPFNVNEAFQNLWKEMASNPTQHIEYQQEMFKETLDAWQKSVLAFLGQKTPNDQEPFKDRRFLSDNWELHPYFSFLKQSYLITSDWVLRHIKDAKNLSDEDRKKLLFHTQQYMNALSPANFPNTNPEVIEETLRSGGENLLRGLENLIKDFERGEGKLEISMTNYADFEIGKNIAVTPGEVVYQNDLMQLIQYTPSTEKVFKTPLLIIPPWINKYYILDLNDEKSFVKWLVAQGHTVFLISWVNPDERHKNTVWENYMFDGALTALKEIEKITKETEVNTIGYCIGGTMLSTLLAWMHVKDEEKRIKSSTFLTSMIDFEQSGDMRVFVDDTQIKMIEDQMDGTGYLDADYMKTTFSMMRANDLIWSFVINNYLMGKEPFAFDLLYWNDDSTNLCAKTHSFYLRNMYLKNALIEPNAVELDGVGINMKTIKTPSYFLSTETDHIAPWQTTYTPMNLFSGDVTFTLGASGHIAGVVNPPSAQKYHYWKNETAAQTPMEWKETAKKHEGSWWPDWQNWIEQYTGEKIPARTPKNAIESAPGSYVKVKS